MNRLVSGIILAGGKSKRMGTDKSDLILQDKTFLETIIQTMKDSGIDDIIVSGYKGKTKIAYPIIDDEIFDRGPLGGIYSCLKSIKNFSAVVLCVDMPFIDQNIMKELILCHQNQTKPVTLLSHLDGKLEPLIAIYNRNVVEEIYNVIEEASAPVFRVLDRTGYGIYHFDGDETSLININSLETYKQYQNNLHLGIKK